MPIPTLGGTLGNHGSSRNDTWGPQSDFQHFLDDIGTPMGAPIGQTKLGDFFVFSCFFRVFDGIVGFILLYYSEIILTTIREKIGELFCSNFLES